jgi:putative RecB family exonuclease
MALRRLHPVSPTKLDVWQDCRYRYRLQYIERHRVDGSWAHLSMGNAIHGALRDWFDIEPTNRQPDQVGRLVVEQWSDRGFRDAEQSEQWRAAAATMAVGYCTAHPGPVPFGRERTFGTVAEHVTISGRIDRIDERDGELVIVDYKTGKQVPTATDARVSRALAIYALIAQRSLRRPAFEVQLHHVPSAVIASHRHTPESLERQLSRVDAIGRDMAAAEESGRAADFPTSTGPLCGWCDFRALCPDSGGVPAQPSWAGLPTAPDDTDTFPV